uniref:NADH-ubiquinone oxidoreductase chain 4 n=1 Tax=Chaetopleura apiculata TaxID=58794 RepID=A0A343S5A3_CHAAP|nr:NADH dehydrogenase subunit 4 [Chaetopleura apiculata]
MLIFYMKSKISWYFMSWSFLVMFLMLLPSFYSLQDIPHIYLEFSVDSFSSILTMLSCWISSLMILSSSMILNKNMEYMKFMKTVNILNSIIILVFIQKNLFMLYIFFESSLIPTLILILIWGYQPERLQAGMYFIIYTVVGALPLLINLLFMYKINGHSIFLLDMNLPFFNNSWMSNLCWFFLIFAFLIKLPMFSAHLWLPKAHVEAPVAGSMILAALLLKLGGYGLIRMMLAFPNFNSDIAIFLISLNLLGGVMTSMICIRQIDMKKLIAYSSVGHMGMMFSGVMSGTSWGLWGSVMMMIGHAFSSSGLFYLSNLVYEKSNSRSLMMCKGFISITPILSLSMFLLCSLNMGAPPSLNLLSEISLIISILSTYFWFFIPLSLMSFLASVYSLFLYTSTQHGKISSFINFCWSMKSLQLLIVYLHWIPSQLLVVLSNNFF